MAASERKAEIVRMRTNGYNFNWDDLTAIIPAYRCANFLPAAVQSLLQCPISIIITEDCGGDDTLPVAEDLGSSPKSVISIRRVAAVARSSDR